MRKAIVFTLFLFSFLNPVQAQTAPDLWQAIVAFKKLDSIQPPPTRPIVFVGSSSFTKWKDVNRDLPGYPIINRGFGGAILLDVIRYSYDVIIRYQPKQVVIYCGENDLAGGDSVSAAEVVLRVKTLFGIIRTNLPQATIDFISMKPSPVRAGVQEKIKAANKEVKAFFKTQKNAAFIDLYNAMLDAKGNMREELYLADRLHMKPEGYVIWTKIIQPYLLK